VVRSAASGNDSETFTFLSSGYKQANVCWDSVLELCWECGLANWRHNSTNLLDTRPDGLARETGFV
jgi:hypothetical protein